MRVLVVEDEFLLAMNLENMLSELGHEVVGLASNKQEALEVVDGAEIAFVDVRLSDGVTGPEIAETLKARHGVTVVFTTGNPEMVLESRAGVGVVKKPYSDSIIRGALSYAAARRQGRHVPAPAMLTRIPVAI
ncbi:response regulator [Neorhizobium lilium]|uniref:Response regulator n=1 Tax=Neorhizobium lilium TaxID=2503024 RepID=A0A444LG89_9HYPH|nr:response regulator [Neorhizobium lilium]RWX77073.1 response regulator [Neorhizobium lilium]